LQPVDSVVWRHIDELTANNYNPNFVAPPELELIKVSLIEDGWTAPIVVAGPPWEIVDGFHRWLCVKKDRRVYALTAGLVPTVEIKPKNRASMMMATIRHNRARGTHAVLEMAKIIQTMVEDDKLPMPEICERLGMEPDEIIRLAARVGIPQTAIIAATGWSKEWRPTRRDREKLNSEPDEGEDVLGL
jgi:ParB-like chromosome segregation protein Spo0J